MRKINNFTSVDALGAQYNLYREKTETLEEFQSRVRSCVRNELIRDKYSFQRSLDYITKERTLDVLRVKLKSNYSVSFDGVKLEVMSSDGSNSLSLEVDSVKFLKDLKDSFNSAAEEIIELEKYDPYLKTKNVLPFESDRVRLRFETPKTNLVELNENNIKETVDYNGLYSEQEEAEFEVSFSDWDNSNHLEEFYIDNTSEKTRLLRESKEADSLTYEYKEKYLIIKWSVFSYFDLNSENLDYRIKEKVRVSSTDTEDTPHILTQDGAKLLNKCYKISNTYWGE